MSRYKVRQQSVGSRSLSLTSIFVLLISMMFTSVIFAASDPLPSWRDGNTKTRILTFVKDVTDKKSKDYVAPAERIAVFDNDGTLWSEQPMYFQLAFVLDRLKQMAPQHPEWKTTQPFKAALESDFETVAEGGEHALLELVMVTHASTTTDEFTGIVADWIDSAKHPRFNKPYTELVYKPMLEVLSFLRANNFKTFIVSGGGIEFMRVFSEKIYGVPPEQVIGSSIMTRFELRDGKPVLVRLPEINFIDDKAGKPVGINQHIGRQPIAAFGNSDGDFQMLQWTSAGSGARLGVIIHHTDDEREWSYDRKSHIGKLDKGLDEAGKNNWLVVDMKKDWLRVFSFKK